MAGKIQISNVADEVFKRYKDDPFERVRVLYGIKLRPFQWEWWFLMDQHADVLANACFRVGKTYVMGVKGLDEKLQTPYEEEMIFAPKHDQAVKTFKTQYDIIDKQPVVNAFVRRNSSGKQLFGLGFVEFINSSSAKTFGVTSNFEGENATIQHVDELDDVPSDTLKRVKGRATGINRNGKPTRHRFSGVIWGKLNIWKYEDEARRGIEGAYHVLPKVNVYQGLAAGWLDKKAVMDQRREMSDDEWLRTQVLEFVESRNFIWSSKLRLSQMIGLKWNINPVVPNPGEVMQRDERELISFGLDMGAQGSGSDASDYVLEVTASKGRYRRWVYGVRWPGTADPETVINGVCELWRFFRPNGGYGDSLDANIIAMINDRLYELGYVRWNWRKLGANELDGWPKWAKRGLLTPLVNGGRIKHHFYNSLKKAIDNCSQIANLEIPSGRIFIFPQIDRYKAKELEHWKELQILIRELENLQSERTAGGYYKIDRIQKKIDDKELQFDGSSKLSDDGPDALAMSNYYLDFLEKKNLSRRYSGHYIPGV